MKTKHYLISAALLTAITAAIAATHIYKGQDSVRENNGTSISQSVAAQTETSTKNVHNAEKATQGISRTARKEDKSKTTAAATSSVMETTYTADHPSGIIGQPDGRVSDNPEDNIFEITVEKVSPNMRAWLVYDLKGVSSGQGISRSINDRTAVGGYLTALSKDWKTVREEISPEWLKDGRNTVLFTIPTDASYAYSVRNVHIETVADAKTKTNTNKLEEIILSSAPIAYDGQTYLHGFVRGKASRVSVNGTILTVHDGEFEGIVPSTGRHLTLTATIAGRDISRTIAPVQGGRADYARALVSVGGKAEKQFLAHRADSIAIGGNVLSVKAADIARDGRYSVTALRETDIPALDYGMTNVTAKGDGYRFLPHGNHFEGKGATVKIKYDRTRIPSGFTEDDINTYYFDQDTRHWVALERVKVDKATACVVSKRRTSPI